MISSSPQRLQTELDKLRSILPAAGATLSPKVAQRSQTNAPAQRNGPVPVANQNGGIIRNERTKRLAISGESTKFSNDLLSKRNIIVPKTYE